MKIKQIKIQAFKSYLFDEDGTFDFRTNEVESGKFIPANLISIYAPNGFGKTSFYDAVDYAVTNNIGRYLRDGLDKQNKIQGAMNNIKGKRQYILRNREADIIETRDNIKLLTKVEIETTKQTFVSKYKKPNNSYMDYTFDPKKSNLDTEYFSTVLLSQDAIDAFLRENNPHDRFKKFVDNADPELKEFDHKRISLSQMCKDILSRNDELEEEIATLDNIFEKMESIENPFDEANTIVDELNIHKDYFNALPFPFLDDHIERFKNQKVVYENQLDNTSKQRVEYKACIEELLNEIDTLKRNVEESNKAKLELSIIEQTVKTNFSIQSQLNALSINDEKIQVDSENIKTLERLIPQVDPFVEHRSKSKDLKKEFATLNSCLKEQHNLKKTQNELLTNLRRQVSNISLEKANLLMLRASSLEVYSSIEGAEARKSQKNSNLSNLLKSKNEYEVEKINLDSNINLFKLFSIETLISVKFKGVNSKDEVISNLNRFHSEFTKQQRKLVSLKRKKDELSDQLQRVEAQSKAIVDLINVASEIVLNTPLSACPVCQKQYEDVQSLHKKISSNSILSEVDEGISIQFKNLVDDSFILQTEIDKLKKSYKEQCNLLIDSELASSKKMASFRNEIENKIEEEGKELKQIEKFLKEKKSDVLNKSKVELTEYISNKLKENDIQTAKLASNETEIELEIHKIDQQVQTDEVNIIKYKNSLKALDLDFEKYLEFRDVLIKNGVSIEADKEVILSFLNKKSSFHIDQFKRFKSSKEEISENIKSLESRISIKYSQLSNEELFKTRDGFEKIVYDSNHSLMRFYSTCKKLDTSLPTNEDDWTLLIERSKIAIDQIITLNSKDIELLGKIDLLSKLSNEAKLYSDRLLRQQELTDKKNELRHHKRILEPLEKDLQKINEYIENTANKYFRTDLINQIYSSIDPHPEYKNIFFECKVPTNDKAELNISLVNPSNGDKVSPNLHFSSAQINVLSLSIFLARALTAVDNSGDEVNCIFIDDPIQSMDSINVLSLIDLFRIFCTRFGKQLIISTHDENFHELLKKKIPPSLFKSKFLSLSSFGKVEEDVL
jgi:exonuclease SbcC